VSESEISLYYKNVMADVIGDEHGITRLQFEDLGERTSALISQLNEERKAGRTPYRDLPYRTQIADRVREVVAEIKDGCEILVVLGIGGSALGSIAVQTALNPYMHNIDEAQRRGPRMFDKLDKTIFNVISKSGRTAETASQLMIIRQLLLEKLGSDGFRNQVVATTDARAGTLRNIAAHANLRALEVPDGVGGRFTVLSAVGLFSAAMCGVDIDSLLAGAGAMDERVSREDFAENPAAMNAAINYHFYNNGKKNSVIMPYSYALKNMADWYRQLWAESLGKRVDLNGRQVWVGPTPIKALGTTDQHSQVQLYREGPNDKLFTFLQVKHFNSDLVMGPAPDCAGELGFLASKKMSELLNNEKKATEYALLQDERPCLTVLFDQINAHTVGQFIYLFEVTTSFVGALFNINPYDQPAVELGKEATFALMGRMGSYTSDCTYEQFAEEIRAKTDIDESYLV